jgi:hypothetical protein
MLCNMFAQLLAHFLHTLLAMPTAAAAAAVATDAFIPPMPIVLPP